MTTSTNSPSQSFLETLFYSLFFLFALQLITDFIVYLRIWAVRNRHPAGNHRHPAHLFSDCAAIFTARLISTGDDSDWRAVPGQQGNRSFT